MKIQSTSLAVALSFSMISAACAGPLAVITNSTGPVSVQTAGGVQDARAGFELSVGDRVVTGEKGSAVVSYLRGACRGDYSVGEFQTAAIRSKLGRPCELRTSSNLPETRTLPLEPTAAGASSDSSLYLLGGAVVAAGAGVGIYFATQSNSKSP